MKQVVKPWKKKKEENQMAVLKLEIDYELVTLFDAMTENNADKINSSKVKLEKLRKEMLSLEV
ncbi:hypothetical protein JOC95_003655 [Bacillus tianshenii]|uniref:Uncharacterized protein n=1 Tax=Sutcliffiella tianshenii TaxID=1463404 RepID=A0ABS2P458_9BACI|nr:hypothetical protein [Bacillus tianshenii]MBM7621747.1 hypothetical protein [Bacillus tianshenii]MCA1319003.1 hypothetical protein [Bacillus tianshenii]